MKWNIKYVNSILIKLDTQVIDFYLCIHIMGYLKDSIYLQDRGSNEELNCFYFYHTINHNYLNLSLII